MCSRIKNQLSAKLPVHGVKSCSLKIYPIVTFAAQGGEEDWVSLILKMSASKGENSRRVMKNNRESTAWFCYSSVSQTSSVLGSIQSGLAAPAACVTVTVP